MAVYAFSFLVLLAAVVFLFSDYAVDPSLSFGATTPLPQGRYLFPVIIPIATILMLGFREVLPAQRRRLGTAVAVLILVAFNLGSLFLLILPHYYSI